jgi:hypothetical protein
MKIEYKSMLLGALLGITGCFVILLLVGNVETEFSFTTDNKPKELNKNIDVSIERTVKNEQDHTDVIVKAVGDVTQEDIDKELERLFEVYNIDKDASNINIDVRINS